MLRAISVCFLCCANCGSGVLLPSIVTSSYASCIPVTWPMINTLWNPGHCDCSGFHSRPCSLKAVSKSHVHLGFRGSGNRVVISEQQKSHNSPSNDFKFEVGLLSCMQVKGSVHTTRLRNRPTYYSATYERDLAHNRIEPIVVIRVTTAHPKKSFPGCGRTYGWRSVLLELTEQIFRELVGIFQSHTYTFYSTTWVPTHYDWRWAMLLLSELSRNSGVRHQRTIKWS